MFTRHPSNRLAAYCDEQVFGAEAATIEAHLHTCEQCRLECDNIRFASSAVRHLPLCRPPDSIWQLIEQQLPQRRPEFRRLASEVAPKPPAGSQRKPQWHLALAASLALLVTAAGLYVVRSSSPPSLWDVAFQQHGASAHTARKATGDWIETTQDSRAHIVVGTIGSVDVAPNARVQLRAMTDTQYRLALERGTISAQISAPPRMFIVDTPASAIVDLGCAYTVTVGLDGVTELRMTSGWAALEWNGTETLVPAGAVSRTRKGRQPGLPYFEDAPAPLREGLNAIDSLGVTDDQLTRVLDEARVRDTLSLWHLLSRTKGEQRVRVYDRLQELVAPPVGVTRDHVLQLDPDALRTWREELAWHW